MVTIISDLYEGYASFLFKGISVVFAGFYILVQVKLKQYWILHIMQPDCVFLV